MVNAISSLVSEELEELGGWEGTVAAPNGSIYGIPYYARRAVKFNSLDESITRIEPDLSEDDIYKWFRGAMTNNGIIYCPPYDRRRGILRIDTNTDTVTVLDVNLFPERGHCMFESCATALNGCIYFMPHNTRRIMKLDPNNNDAISSVGDDLGYGCKYIGTVTGIDGCVYGTPFVFSRIVKYNPINDSTCYLGEEADSHMYCSKNGVLGRDGRVHAVVRDRRVLKIDTTNNSHCIVGNEIDRDCGVTGRIDGILGIDGCIYWPPSNAAEILKYDPHSNLTSLVGDDFGTHDACKWRR